MPLVQGPLTDRHWWMLPFAFCAFPSREGLWKGKLGQTFCRQEKWTECPLCIFPRPEDCGTLSWDAVTTGSLLHCFFLWGASSWVKCSASPCHQPSCELETSISPLPLPPLARLFAAIPLPGCSGYKMLTAKSHLLFEASRMERGDRMVSDLGDQSGMRQRCGDMM